MAGFQRQPRGDDAAAGAGGPLDDLLKEMRELRLTLAADLTAAAGATEAGADDVAADIVDADRLELARFARVADQRLVRLQQLATSAQQPPRWRRRVAVALPVVPVVGAMALSAAAATGVLHLPGGSAPSHSTVAAQSIDSSPAASTFRHLVSVLDSHPSRSEVIAAAAKLHRQLSQLIASSPSTPGGAAEIAELLRMERSLVISERPPGAQALLDATRELSARLVTVARHLSPTVSPTFIPTVAPSSRPDHAAKPSPSPASAPKKASAPKPAPSASQPPPPSASPSPSGTPFPTLPNG